MGPVRDILETMQRNLPNSLLFALLAGAIALSGGCALWQSSPTAADACLQDWDTFRAAVQVHDVADAQYPVIEGYPFLRSSRLLASLAVDLEQADPDSAPVRDWLQAAWEHGSEAARVEWGNLPASARQQLRSQSGAPLQLEALLSCASARFSGPGVASRSGRQILRNAQVPDAYNTLARAAGYVVARHVARSAVDELHEELRARAGRPDPDAKKRVLTGPASPGFLEQAEVAALLQAARARSPLRMPRFTAAEESRLLAHFAPVLHLGVATPSDLVGAAGFDRRGDIEVRIGNPAAYTMVSATRWRGEVLTQLNYLFWFPRRAARSMVDFYAGKLDGFLWRVTLLPDGRVLVYDSIHPCGCYHTLYLPSQPLVKAREPGMWAEPVLVHPQPVPDPYTQRVRLQVSAIDHHVLAIDGSDPLEVEGKRPYSLRHYNDLRTLTHPVRGQASLFDPDGMVPGTERLERAYLWPLGVRSPGQMRQWGHHATAFVGRRHFDDAFLFESLLE